MEITILQSLVIIFAIISIVGNLLSSFYESPTKVKVGEILFIGGAFLSVLFVGLLTHLS